MLTVFSSLKDQTQVHFLKHFSSHFLKAVLSLSEILIWYPQMFRQSCGTLTIEWFSVNFTVKNDRFVDQNLSQLIYYLTQ